MEILKKLDYKWFIIIGETIILSIVIFFAFRIVNQVNTKTDSKIAILTDSVNRVQGRLDIYKFEEKKLLDEISVKQEVINNQKIVINKLKKKLNEKADSIYDLSDTQSIEFLTDWLSKRDNIK